MFQTRPFNQTRPLPVYQSHIECYVKAKRIREVTERTLKRAAIPLNEKDKVESKVDSLQVGVRVPSSAACRALSIAPSTSGAAKDLVFELYCGMMSFSALFQHYKIKKRDPLARATQGSHAHSEPLPARTFSLFS